MATIKTVGIVGTGVIGASWTALSLSRGLKVMVADPGPGAADELSACVGSVWPALRRMGIDRNAKPDNYKFVGKHLGEHITNCDFIQEALDVKTKSLAELDRRAPKHVIIASSSSGLPSSRFVGQCQHPERVLIGHPFNPPHLMPLVEVVPHKGTSDSAIKGALAFYESVGRKPVHIRQVMPGFAAKSLQAALYNKAYSLVSRGVLSAEDLDACVTSSLGPRWAVVGLLLANAMGGGGGSDGFRHLLEHLGPASKEWIEDMNAHTFGWNTESLDALTKSVGEEFDGKYILDSATFVHLALLEECCCLNSFGFISRWFSILRTSLRSV
ncbi:putative hydroxyacyl-CoA dehydrogenase [Aureobasidium pullulans]|uniref:Putative hydroxyacyl-CoA dehydrogenase n=1 Tax=Aureobasidium pullulans TaxID=5580 RepID=A0A4S9KTA4_AURPU|nr:putative hydroxyacyl-CoA dehydrogenase [Aureobasidium pullulans]